MKMSLTSWKERQLVQPVHVCVCVCMRVCMCVEQDKNAEV